MNPKPHIHKIRRYLETKKFVATQIKYIGGGNHFNYFFKSGPKELVLRIANPNAIGSGDLFNVASEFKVLRAIEKHNVSPKAILLDQTSFVQPLLVESFVRGLSYSDFKTLDKKMWVAAFKLIAKVSAVKINPRMCRFKLTSYQTNIRTWHERIKEIKILNSKHKQTRWLTQEFSKVAAKVVRILLRQNKLLRASRRVFIYNDIHGDNLLWIPQKQKALFVDWQKVSWGDPAFMPTVFALAFENKSSLPREKFFDWIIEQYAKYQKVENFKNLFWLRVLEREVSNMIWIPWSAFKQDKSLPFKSLSDYERFSRTVSLLKNFDIMSK